MMTGIDVEGLENIIKKATASSLKMENTLGKIKNTFEQLKSCHEGVDLNFLYGKYEDEINQLDNVNLKVSNYPTTLTDVISGYKDQELNIASSVNLYLDK